MFRYLILVALALVACSSASEQTTSAPPPAPVPDDPVAAQVYAVEADVARWYATALWNGTVAWNEAVAANAAAEAVEEKSRTSRLSGGAGAYEGPSGGIWAALAECESGGDWSYNGSSGFDGGLQFHPGTWSAYAPDGYPAYAWQASVAQQIAVAERVLAVQGWGAWPACSRALGLR